MDAGSTYQSLFWGVPQGKRITPEQVQDACKRTNQIKDEIPELSLWRLRQGGDSAGGHVLFVLEDPGISEPSPCAWFGFPPQKFLDGLTPRERRAVQEMGTARDGWLSIHGQGSGMISTEGGWEDLLIRIFLACLVEKGCLQLECSMELDHQHGLVVTSEMSGFAWYPRWEELRPRIEQVIRVAGSHRVIAESGLEPTCYDW